MQKTASKHGIKMYLKKLRFKSYGPLANCEIEFAFNEAGNPRPMVLVGTNGSGKTICLSVALDAFITMRSSVSNDLPEVKHGKLFKPLKQTNRYLGRPGLALSECTFKTNGSEIIFAELMTAEKVDGNFCLPEGFAEPNNFDKQRFQEMGMSKSLSTTDQSVLKDAVFKDVFSYYPTGRAEKPSWLANSSPIEFGNSPRFSDVAGYNSWRTNLIDGLSGWMRDVVLDSELYDLLPVDVNLEGRDVKAFVRTNGRNRKLLNHINHILSLIIGTGKAEYDSARVAIAERHQGSRSISVYAKRKSDGVEDVVANNLSDLSTGELAVLCIFADLIRVAEIQGWDRNELTDIRGVVLIDEADLHLHVRLQKDVLPKLFALMPKVQFVLTTHSPLLALGAAEQGATIINLPTGRISDPTEFSEFDEAYQIFVDKNDQFKDELRAIKAKMAITTKPLVVTEGKTDKKHLELAMVRLLDAKLIPPLELEFHDVGNDMGSGELQKIFDTYAKMGSERPVLCVFDRDEKKVVNKFGSGDGYLVAGNVIGLCLALPDHRAQTPEICIEHLYLDETLATCLAGTEKRLRFEHVIAGVDGTVRNSLDGAMADFVFRHLPPRKRSPDPAAAGFSRCFRGLCGTG